VKIVFMTIFINGEARELDNGLTVAAMLDALELPKQRVAIELNRRVVRKQEWESTAVSDNDRIEVVHFVGGG
jgi:thiamine biosynthesis protein ThiS